MKRHLHLLALIAFFISLADDLVVWGALPLLPDVGAPIVASARREAPLATSYIAIGQHLDAAVPALQALGAQRLDAALGDLRARIQQDPTAAMDLIFNTNANSAHRWLKTMYWAAPVFLLLTLLLWWLRPRQVNALARRP